MKYDILPINEFVMWDNCQNNCSFCFQKKHGRIFSDEIQIKSIHKLKNIVDDNKLNDCHMLIVGGEIFTLSEKVKCEFLNLIDSIVFQIKCNKIKYLYINTNLIYNDTSCLNEFLKKFIDNNIIDRLKFTTSYDLFGRFTDKSRIIFENNLKSLTYISGLNIVANTILTKQFCQYVKDNFSRISYVKYFEDTFRCKLNLIPFVNVNSEMLPTTDDVFTVLANENINNPNWFVKFKDNYNLKQQKNVYKFDGNEFMNNTANNNSCGHSANFSRYSTSDTCFICDVNKLFES